MNNSHPKLLIDLAGHRMQPGWSIYWEDTEEFDNLPSLVIHLLDAEGRHQPLHFLVGDRFHLVRKVLASENAAPSGTPLPKGVYLGPFVRSRSQDTDFDPWQRWVVENWELGHAKAYHFIVELDEFRIDLFAAEPKFGGKNIELPPHPNRTK